MLGAYLRVSTQKQKKDGISIKVQMKMIIDYAIMLELIKKKQI